MLWVSVSSDLRVDAARDLDDLGLKKLDLLPERGSAGAVPKGKLSPKAQVLFFTYSLLVCSLSPLFIAVNSHRRVLRSAAALAARACNR